MTWLAVRLLRPYLVVATVLAALATAYTVHATSIVQRQLDGLGLPGCTDPNQCYPQGSALNAVLGMELIAAFAPPLLGLILGVGLFAREREDDTIAFVLTQSISRRRWVSTKFGVALAAGVTLSAIVALTHRLLAVRYTALADDTYELLQLLHFNNAAYMVAQTAVLTAVAGLLGLSTGRVLRTLVLSVVVGPIAFMFAIGVAVALGYVVLRPFSGSAGMDPLAYLVSVVAAAGVLAVVLLAPRVGVRESR